jgi:hypothetical protein
MQNFGMAAVYIGLSNPAAQTGVTVTLDLSARGSYSVVHAAGFLPAKSIEQDADLHSGSCPLNISLPNGTGTVLEIDKAI